MFGIKDIKEAREVWKDFYKHHNENIFEAAKISVDPPKKNWLLEDPSVIQALIRGAQQRDGIPVKESRQHSKAFNKIINKQLVHRSISIEKEKLLLAALEKVNLNDKIFDDPHILSVALNALDHGKIIYQQFFTIIERVLTFESNKHVSTHNILDDQGQFTEDAEEILLPVLANRRSVPSLKAAELEEFRLLIAALPKSEQIFYLTETESASNDKNINDNTDENTVEDTLEQEMISRNVLLHSPDANHLLHLSFGAKDAMYLEHFGMKNYVRRKPMFGPKGIEEIEAGIRARYRVSDLVGKRNIKHKKIHRYDANFMTANYHDEYHSLVMSALGEKINNALLHLVDILRIQTANRWSFEIWSFLDSDYGIALVEAVILGQWDEKRQQQHLADPKRNSKKFEKILMVDEDFILNNSLIAAIIFSDMIDNKDVWASFDIYPEYFSDSIKIFYDVFEQIYPAIKSDSLIMKAFKITMSFDLLDKSPDQQKFLPTLLQMIDALQKKNHNNFASGVSIDKHPKDSEDKNRLYLKGAEKWEDITPESILYDYATKILKYNSFQARQFVSDQVPSNTDDNKPPNKPRYSISS